jgi:hypothetical protein
MYIEDAPRQRMRGTFLSSSIHRHNVLFNSGTGTIVRTALTERTEADTCHLHNAYCIINHYHHKNHNHYLAKLELGRLLTRSGLTRLEISVMVSSGFFSQRRLCFNTLTNLLRSILFTCCNLFLLYSCILSKPGITIGPSAVSVFVL